MKIKFLTEERRRTGGLVEKESSNILDGFAVCKVSGGRQVLLPPYFLICLAILAIPGVLLDFATSQNEQKWVIALRNLISASAPFFMAFAVLANQREIPELSTVLDGWWEYRLLQAETDRLRAAYESIIRKVVGYFKIGMYLGLLMSLTLPLGKFMVSSENIKLEDLLPFQCWTPFPQDTWWGLGATYFCITLIISMNVHTCTQVYSFIFTVSITISFHFKLLGEAFVSMDLRVKRMMTETKPNLMEHEKKRIYEKEMRSEMRNCIIHFQTLRRQIKLEKKVFKYLLNLSYHSGMWYLVLGASQAAVKSDHLDLVPVFALMGNGFAVILASSIIGEITETESLRQTIYSARWYEMPLSLQKDFRLFQIMLLCPNTHFETVMGTKANMENFMKVLNAAYYYYSTIVAINK